MRPSAKGKSAAVHWHPHSTSTRPLIPAAGYWLSCPAPKGPSSMRDMCVSLINYPPHTHTSLPNVHPILLLLHPLRFWIRRKDTVVSSLSPIHSCAFRRFLLPLAGLPLPSFLSDCLSARMGSPTPDLSPQASALSPGYHVGERPGLCLPV